MHKPSSELAAALRAAARAGAIIKRYYRQGIEVETKPDRSPVTKADREAEMVIREVLLEAFPDYGFSGEEFGDLAADADNVWLVDPLDGTKSFVRGYPFVSTQIALMRNGELELGVSSAPMFDEVAAAQVRRGAQLNAAPLRVSKVSHVEDATLSTGNIGTLAMSRAWSAFGALVNDVHRIRGYGDFYHYHLLAAGRIDAVIESDVNIHDIAT